MTTPKSKLTPEVKRYEVVDVGMEDYRVEECPDGRYVLYEDFEAIKKKLDNAMSWGLSPEAVEQSFDAHEVTLEFFRKYLKMPGANLEDLCRRCEGLTGGPEAPRGL